MTAASPKRSQRDTSLFQMQLVNISERMVLLRGHINLVLRCWVEKEVEKGFSFCLAETDEATVIEKTKVHKVSTMLQL
jgi:hypothetical protein